MFNNHSLIPWGSFRGRQVEKWGSFRGRDHFGGCTDHLLVKAHLNMAIENALYKFIHSCCRRRVAVSS